MRAAHTRVHGGDPGETILPAVTDCRFYGRYYGIPSLSYGASGEGSHGFDESVDLASIKTLTLTIASFVADWCGTRPVTSAKRVSLDARRRITAIRRANRASEHRRDAHRANHVHAAALLPLVEARNQGAGN